MPKAKAAKRVKRLPKNYKPLDDETFMSARQREYFRRKLMEWRGELLQESSQTLQHLQEDTEHEIDLADRASSETDRALELRTRDRLQRRDGRAAGAGYEWAVAGRERTRIVAMGADAGERRCCWQCSWRRNVAACHACPPHGVRAVYARCCCKYRCPAGQSW